VALELEGAEMSLFPIEAGEVSPGSVFRGILTPDEDGIASTPPLEPRIYRFEVRASGSGPNGPILVDGLVEVEEWAASLRHPPLAVPERLAAASEASATGGDGGRPLRTHPLPYIVALLLLCAEWLGRRRVGLR
jgi:hypothetical protein